MALALSTQTLTQAAFKSSGCEAQPIREGWLKAAAVFCHVSFELWKNKAKCKISAISFFKFFLSFLTVSHAKLY